MPQLEILCRASYCRICEPAGYFTQRDGGSIVPSDWEGQHDGGSKSVSLGHKTLLEVHEVFPSPWLTEEADEWWSHRHTDWPALGVELLQPHPDINV
jgi:hypothetical protein